MSITDELRGFASNWDWLDRGSGATERKILTIADRIDAEHEKAMSEQPCTIDMVPITDERMAEHGWIRLPKDANGEYIYPKDMLTDGKKVYTVTNITFNQCGFIVYGYSDNSRNEWPIDEVSKLHHHHEPTVEDVLREFGEKYCDVYEGSGKESELFAEYAAKLRLANSEEQ